METDTGDSEGGDRDDSPWSKKERDRDDPGKENVSPVVQISNPHLSGDGVLKQRSLGQI